MADVDFNLTLNLASLPREEALRRARIAGRAFLEDSEALREGFREIGEEWLNANMPIADGQTDDEFGELGDALEAEFTRALLSGLQASRAHSGNDVSFKFPESASNRVDTLLNAEAVSAWKIHDTLAFMIEALPADKPGGLPLQCLLMHLHTDMNKLASNLGSLGDLISEVRHE